MHSLLSVLVTKEPATCAVNLYQANPRTVKNVLTTRVRGCGAFIECIADLDNAHFISKFEMWDLCDQLMETKSLGIPIDRLVAAKKLSKVLSLKQKGLPEADKVLPEAMNATKCFMPQSTILPPRLGTKSALQLSLLEKGTTISEMTRVLGWKEGSVHSGLNYDLNHIRGFGYRVEKRDRQEDLYTLVLPDWYKGPLYLPPRIKKALEVTQEQEAILAYA